MFWGPLKYSKYFWESECGNVGKKEDFWQPFSKPYQNFITFSSHNWFSVMNKLMQCFKRLFIIYDYKAVEMVYVGSKFCHTDLTLLCVYVCVCVERWEWVSVDQV